jgi:hypothetical protein
MIKEDLLRRRTFTVWVQLFRPVRVMDEGTITGSVFVK